MEVPNHVFWRKKTPARWFFEMSNELPSIINNKIHPALLNKHISKQAIFFTNFTIIIWVVLYTFPT